MSGPLFDVVALCVVGCVLLALAVARLFGHCARPYPHPPVAVPDDPALPTYEPGPPETPWLVETDIAHLQAIFLSRLGQPCPPVLCDEIADRRRAKAGLS